MIKSEQKPFPNPFRPGAGHTPPYLAGRNQERLEYERLLRQDVILENLILTGLRGVGKTVLLESFKPLAFDRNWFWIGNDLSESSSISEERIAIRLLADLSVVTSSIATDTAPEQPIGFGATGAPRPAKLDYEALFEAFDDGPGLVADKLKKVLELVWNQMRPLGKKGIIFAYDEAQNLMDHADQDQYPLSVLLDVFQSIQRREIPFMLILTGLPTLFPKLVESRTYSERMFRVVFLDRLSASESREAITKPLGDSNCPVRFNQESVASIIDVSGGYPYFIQFICREVFDVFIQQISRDKQTSLPAREILHKLDTDFFAGRWAKATDRQRELLSVIARLEKPDSEFTVKEIVNKSRQVLERPFSQSHVNQMLSALGDAGLVYRNRRGKYSFAVPLLGSFILRQMEKK